MMNKLGIAAVALAVAGTGGAWLIAAPAERPGLLPYRDPAILAEGRRLYDSECATCHGTDLQGEPNWREPDEEGYLPAPPHDESGHTWHHPDEVLMAITALGTAQVVGDGYKSRMPGFGDRLTMEEIAAALAYIKSTWPPEIQQRHDQINAAAAGR